MKKICCLFIALMIISVIVKGQNTCINAKNLFTTAMDTIPPVGTISPSGPDYGCLTETGRQLWYYVPVCQSYYAMALENTVSIGTNDTIGMIFYGPFDQKVSNCADITAGKIIACYEYWGFSNYMLILDTNLLEGKYYYALLTFSDGLQGLSFSHISPFQGPNFTCYECNNQVSVIYENNLCLVSVDTAINKCVLTWEEFPGTNLMGYNILRETSLTGLYDSVTTIPLGSMSTYTDMTSSPAQHNVTYKIVGVDSCGQSQTPQYSPELTSIHLITYSGGNNVASLIWNNVYTSNNFVPQYYIHRNNNGGGWQIIDSIGITLPTITYTDIFAPAGINQYAVELRKLVPCVPMRMTSNPYQSVFSNTTLVSVTVTEEFLSNSSISIYPNPTNDFLCINTNFSSAKEVSYTLFNLYGQKVKELYTGKSSIGKQEQKFSLKEFPSGIYFVKMNVDGKEEVKKLVKL
ncbi:MAG TPA: T9SS type A sorting domain-containing protein [Bacteroidia bacterium]|nr:T9SS type A sorting domain-containing protein [Bacteroidia bacterium]